MNRKINSLFADTDGGRIYNKIVSYIAREGIDRELNTGVLLGLSGGADSVFLLSFLIYYKESRNLDFPIVACHVNHSIRHGEADRDEEFSKQLSSMLDIEFISRKIDVPTLAKISSQGLEETARNARYKCFDDIIKGRSDVNTIAVAHNATDNCETVIFNLARGAGINGIAGIKPRRDNIVRPILCVSKAEISALLDRFEIPYVTDSTNSDCDYTRNFIRHKILPLINEINPSYTDAFMRMSESLGGDIDYISASAKSEYRRILNGGRIARDSLLTLHSSLCSRVLMLFAKEYADATISYAHVSDIMSLLKNDNFTYSITGEYNFVCERGICCFTKKGNCEEFNLNQRLSIGYNVLSGCNADIYIGRSCDFSSSNIYKFSIQTYISSAIIDSDMFVRFKNDGDSYRYGNMTHKLKKVFNDRDVPPSVRGRIPIVCDNDGIVWVPGLGVRDGLADKNSEYIIALCIKEPNSTDTEIFTLNKLNA